MGKKYYLSKKCEVSDIIFMHLAGCKLLPDLTRRLFLGTFYHERDAFLVAKLRLADVRPCYECLSCFYKK